MITPDWLERTELLIGNDSLGKLLNSKVLVVGLGGVGSFAAEFLVRAGIGNLTIIDGDEIDATNKNRQLPALDSTVGKSKAGLLEERYLDINPELNLTVHKQFMKPEDMMELLTTQKFDYVLDCIDSVKPKVTLIKMAKKTKNKIISSMGAGGKLDPSKIKITDISKTKECKFAQKLRDFLKVEGITDGVKTVYVEEIQIKSSLKMTDGKNFKKSYYGTISYMPALFGLFMAAEVIRWLGDLRDKK